MVPSRDEVAAQLERVLASDLFATAARLSRFLRFVAERSLAGERERLKEYVIGVEVFDRDERYDPRVDSIVRVEAGRLRTKLEQYYNGPGRDDGIVIRLQKGTYAPSFELRAAATSELRAAATSQTPLDDGRITDVSRPQPDERRTGDAGTSQAGAQQAGFGRAGPDGPFQADTSAPVRRLSPRLKLLLTAAAVAIIGIAVALIATRVWFPAPPADAVAVLPFEPSTSSPDHKLMAERLTEGVTAELVRTGRFSVVPSRDARENGREGSVHSIARRLQASWLLEARVTGEAGTVSVEARMINPAINRKLWVDSFDGSSGDLDDLSRRIGAAAATVLARYKAEAPAGPPARPP